MKILVLSFYYPPDLSAGSFRASAFVAALAERLTSADTIEVLTSVPNRYSTFAQVAPAFEENGSVVINRIPVPRHKSGMLDQSLTFLRFAVGAWRKVGKNNYDMIWATSSRLFTAFLAALLARRRGIPLYLDIRDIFSEAIEDILPATVLKPVWAILRGVERVTVRTASKVNLISEGFAEHFKTMMPGRTYTFLPNGIDEEFLRAHFYKKKQSTPNIVLYAGNIGEGQGLHKIIPPCAKRLAQTHEFLVVGDGGTRGQLEAAIRESQVDNVRVIAPVARAELIKLYKESDYLFLHLNDHKAFRKVLPSKIFEYAATGKPIIAGVSGYAKRFIEAHIDNVAVFEPCDVNAFTQALKRARKGLTPREHFVDQFKRRTIMERMVDDVLECVKHADSNAVSSRA